MFRYVICEVSCLGISKRQVRRRNNNRDNCLQGFWDLNYEVLLGRPCPRQTVRSADRPKTIPTQKCFSADRALGSPCSRQTVLSFGPARTRARGKGRGAPGCGARGQGVGVGARMRGAGHGGVGGDVRGCGRGPPRTGWTLDPPAPAPRTRTPHPAPAPPHSLCPWQTVFTADRAIGRLF